MAGLSGGERRRLSLAVLVASDANVLILDEPTNHLDLDAREALEDALQAFEGALLLVSHDRALLDAVGTRTVAFEDGRLRSLRGRLGGVRARARGAPRGRGRGQARAAEAGEPRATAAAPRRPGRRRTPCAAQAELEREVERAETALKALEDELADPAQWSSPSRAERNTKKHAAAKRAVEEAYARWEEASR